MKDSTNAKKKRMAANGKVVRTIWLTREEDARLSLYCDRTSRPIANALRYLALNSPELNEVVPTT